MKKIKRDRFVYLKDNRSSKRIYIDRSRLSINLWNWKKAVKIFEENTKLKIKVS